MTSLVWNRMGKMEVLYNVKRRRLEYFGHVIRNAKYRPLDIVMEGKIEGRRKLRQRKTLWLKNLQDWFGMDSVTPFCSAVSKVRIALMIADLRRRVTFKEEEESSTVTPSFYADITQPKALPLPSSKRFADRDPWP